jgi:hypothetical protein
MNYTRDHMEAACCLWEVMIDRDFQNSHPLFWAAFEAHGTSEMRMLAVDLAQAVNAAWEALSEDDRTDPFDWEFCPKWLASLDWILWPPSVLHYKEEVNGKPA